MSASVPFRVLVEVKVWALDEDDASQRATAVCGSRAQGVRQPLVKSVERWADK